MITDAMMKFKENHPNYFKIYNKKHYFENRTKHINNSKQYYRNNKEERLKYTIEYYKKYPYVKTLNNIRQRCNNPRNPKYTYYGGRGIKCTLSKEDIKLLWFRDKAYLLKQASIDRKNVDGDYDISNCSFIEMSKNREK